MKKILVLLTLLALALSLLLPAMAEEAPTELESASVQTLESVEEAEEADTGIGNASSLITIGLLLAAMVIALFLSAKRVKWNSSMIAKAAICIALAYVLSMVKMFRMMQGGSVALASLLPLVLFSYAFGPLEGVLIGCVYGLLQVLIDPYVIHPLQLLADYPMAFAATALACAAKPLPIPERLKLPVAVLLGYLGRYVMAVLSGVVFFAEYAGDQPALAYSLVYNLTYLGPEALIAMALALIPGMNRLPELLKRNNV